MVNSVGVIGGGTVGRATARAYLEFVKEVRVYDVLPERKLHEWDDTLASDIVFVCLPEHRLDHFFGAALSNSHRQQNYVIKSTVPVGTTRRLRDTYHAPNVVHSPEFLTERVAETDARIPSVLVIGGTYNDCTKSLHDLYAARFPGVSILMASSDATEAAKLCLNAVFATKVALFNELKALCDKLSLNYETVRTILLADGRITRHHTAVPGPDGQHGFGGKCLPKDLSTLISQYHNAGLEPDVLAAALRRNHRDRGEISGG